MAETITDRGETIYSDFDSRYHRQVGRFGVERVTLTSVPEIDISPYLLNCNGDDTARAKVAREIRDAAISIGFFYLRGHGFAQSELDELLSWGHRFFALPHEEKEKIHWRNNPGKGYIPSGGVYTSVNAVKTADQKERLYIGRESAVDESEAAQYPSESQWPDENLLPGY